MLMHEEKERAMLTDCKSRFAPVTPFAQPVQVEEINVQAAQKDLRGEARDPECKAHSAKS
jgi:hypothetical protein